MSHHHRRELAVNQSAAAIRSKQHKPHQQKLIHCGDSDRANIDNRVWDLLTEIVLQSGISEIWITSTVRDERGQACAMLRNLKTENALESSLAKTKDPIARQKLETRIRRQHVGYAQPGASVISVAQKALAHGDTDEKVVEAMIRRITAVGLTKVTHHAKQAGYNTVDISSAGMIAKFGDADYGRFIKMVQSFVARGQVSRLGWPEGPKGNGRLFHDGGCIHIEFDLEKIVPMCV